ncbi:MAG: hypothetical protein KAU95_01240 [Candidatus Aenigmarchaeota archaeon]|nr:hypothetical protein [Candidatus Aenigmarchaeota archaeon]
MPSNEIFALLSKLKKRDKEIIIERLFVILRDKGKLDENFAKRVADEKIGEDLTRRILVNTARELAIKRNKMAIKVINKINGNFLKEDNKREHLKHKAIIYAILGREKDAENFLGKAIEIKICKSKEEQKFENKLLVQDYAMFVYKAGVRMKKKNLLDNACKKIINSKFGYDDHFLLAVAGGYLEIRKESEAEEIIKQTLENLKKVSDSQKEIAIEQLFALFRKSKNLRTKYFKKAHNLTKDIKNPFYRARALLCCE